jgi:altronate dehydratase
MTENTAFQIDALDNVATALCTLVPGAVLLRGELELGAVLTAAQEVPAGHKIALRDIADGEDIIKYGAVIGRATHAIARGMWVHLHCMRSLYDERSSHLDIVTGAPKDTKYE